MEVHFIVTMLLIQITGLCLAYPILYVLLKPYRRRTPLGIVHDSFMQLYMLHRKPVNVINIDNADYYKIWIADWDRGIWYGYNNSLKVGDHIIFDVVDNKAKVLIIYKLVQPDEHIPGFILFKTFYAGVKKVYAPSKAKRTESKSFQRYN